MAHLIAGLSLGNDARRGAGSPRGDGPNALGDSAEGGNLHLFFLRSVDRDLSKQASLFSVQIPEGATNDVHALMDSCLNKEEPFSAMSTLFNQKVNIIYRFVHIFSINGMPNGLRPPTFA